MGPTQDMWSVSHGLASKQTNKSWVMLSTFDKCRENHLHLVKVNQLSQIYGGVDLFRQE